MKRLYLVDVSSMFFRAFYAIPPLTTSSGLPTNALYGFLAMSIKLLRENKPDYMVFCFDRKEPSFRHEMYEEYKANRSEMPEDLEPQIPYVRELTEKLGILALDKAGFEADDIIGTLAVNGVKENLDVTIVSGDKDFAQLVNGHISLYDTMKNIRYNRQGVVDKWGVEPEQIIDYLAIVGDTSDNIPGVRGVGPKGAQKLLAEFKTLENIYKNLDSIKSESLKSKLVESKESAFLAKKLVSIVTDIPLETHLEDMKLKAINKEELSTLLEKLEFGAFLRKLEMGSDAQNNSGKNTVNNSAMSPDNTSGKNTKNISEKNLRKSSGSNAEAISHVQEKPTQSNFQVTSLERQQWSLEELKKNVEPYDEVWVVQNERGFCIGYANKAIQINAALKEIGHVLGQKKVAWKGFDLKSIWHALGVEEGSSPVWDSMLAGYVVRAGNIDSFAKLYEQHVAKTLPDLAGPEEVLACELELETILKQKIVEMNGQQVLEKFDYPLVPVLYSMEKKGIALDKHMLSGQSVGLTEDLARIEKEIFKIAGESFNIASPKQLGVVLFEKLKIPVVKKTKTGYSTDSDVLTKLAKDFSICDLIIEFRELAKLKSTYVDVLPKLVDSQGRIHTHFHQAVTQTGRLSSSNPNLQNIPIRTARGREIRKAFIAAPEHLLLSIDYSQIELRILAEITNDPGLKKAFLNNQDIHSATAAEIFEVAIEDVDAEQRRMAKAVNFGIAYGQGVFGLSETLGIPQSEAKKIIENYFLKFKNVKEYMFETVNRAKDQGYVETIFGRRRYIDEFKSSNGAVRKFGERAAINAPIQGAASDLMKLAMIEAYGSCESPLLLQVHDELVFECAKEKVEYEAGNIKSIMENVAKFSVPLSVHVAWGDNWEDAHA